MEIFLSINKAISDFLWGPVMCIIFMSVGLLLSVRTGFFQFVKLPIWWRNTIVSIFKEKKVTRSHDKKTLTPFQALTTALSGTIGTGNIVGTATALISGGPGALFWMWISALVGMMTKFSEIALAMKYRYKGSTGEWVGGPMVFLERGLGSKPLAVLFAFFCTLASFGVGSGVQSNSIAGALFSAFGIDVRITGIILTIVAGSVIFGGIKRIGKVTEKLVPFMSLAYIAGGFIVLAINYSQIPEAIHSIFTDAFHLDAAGGGLAGYFISRSMRFGVARGVFTNEAGLGSSAMAHASSDTKEPIKQAMWGCFEVFTDTILMCSITALVILSSGLNLSHFGESGIALSIAAFETVFGSFSGLFISSLLILFAFSTICGWSHYGRVCCEYLFGYHSVKLYQLLYLVAAGVGCVLHANLIWEVADTLNGLMALPNLIGVVALSGVVAKMTRDYFKKSSL